ncbi:MAG TPA: glycosyltransferase family 2 protein [Bryobacteraceae bacterium]|nr:glycosyltransferase family 2 protein [Bryobacteraceae bacterium]
MTGWLWLSTAPAILLAAASLWRERGRAAYIRAPLTAPLTALPPATVIVPVKGPDEGLRQNLAALAAQDYPDYELVVTAATAADIPAGVLPSGVKVAVGRTGDPEASEKIRNLLAGVRASRKGSQVLAFADSDGMVGRGWLRALAAPLAEPGTGAATGYRWHVPEPAGCWPLLRSVWDAVAAGSLGPGGNRFAWGGSMAIRKDTFFEAKVAEFWKSAVSDDYALSAAVRRAGLRIAFAPAAMAGSAETVRAGGFFRWARRQLVITRVHDPGLWWTALAAHVVYCGGMTAAAAALAMGRVEGAVALGLQLIPGMVKGAWRARLARESMPECGDWFRRHGWAHTWCIPLATWLWLAALLTSSFGRSIEWRGRRYRLERGW